MGALVSFENIKVGKKVAPLLSEQSEPYQIDGTVVRFALAKNADVSTPIWVEALFRSAEDSTTTTEASAISAGLEK